jgi:hypothetical protein
MDADRGVDGAGSIFELVRDLHRKRRPHGLHSQARAWAALDHLEHVLDPAAEEGGDALDPRAFSKRRLGQPGGRPDAADPDRIVDRSLA